MRGIVLLLAAGEGARLSGDGPKAFATLGGITLLRRAALAASQAQLVDGIVAAVPSGAEERAKAELESCNAIAVVTGGATRQESAAAALAAAPAAAAFLVHDAARALAPSSLFDACLRELDGCDGVCPAIPVHDTIKRTDADHIAETLDRTTLVAVQTPQGFRSDVYRRAHESATNAGFVGTDDATLVERLGVRVKIVPGDDRNMKITTAHDVAVAEALLGVQR